MNKTATWMAAIVGMIAVSCAPMKTHDRSRVHYHTPEDMARTCEVTQQDAMKEQVYAAKCTYYPNSCPELSENARNAIKANPNKVSVKQRLANLISELCRQYRW